MMTQAQRLRQARAAAGFETGSEAAARFGWSYPTYAAHENGSRGLKPQVAQRYSHAFKVESSWLMFGTDSQKSNRPALAPILPKGMSEPDVTPYIPASRQNGREIEALAEVLAPHVRRRSIYRVGKSYPAYAIVKGDLLVVDAGSQPVAAGAIVIVTLADMTTGEASTVLRQYAGDRYVAPIGLEINGEEFLSKAVLGVVSAVMRPSIPL